MLIGELEAMEMIENSELPVKLCPHSGRELYFYVEERLDHQADGSWELP